MQEMVNVTQVSALADLDSLAAQAQAFSTGAAMNLLQLGRVLCEAKGMVPHGRWEEWVAINAHMPLRTAQTYMQAWRKFGHDDKMQKLGASAIIKLLPMADDERESLLAKYSVEKMTSRELDEIIKAERAKMRQEINAEVFADVQITINDLTRQRDEARQEAERATAAAHEPTAEVLAELTQLREQVRDERANADHFSGMAQKMANDKAAAMRELDALRADYAEQEELLKEQQESIDAAQRELLDLKSAQARGEVGYQQSNDDGLTLEGFTRAAGDFLAIAARMPYMHTTFAGMSTAEKKGWQEMLLTMAGWVKGAQMALNSVTVEGGVVNG